MIENRSTILSTDTGKRVSGQVIIKAFCYECGEDYEMQKRRFNSDKPCGKCLRRQAAKKMWQDCKRIFYVSDEAHKEIINNGVLFINGYESKNCHYKNKVTIIFSRQRQKR